MTDRLHPAQRYRRILEGLLREHVPEAEVWAYGSRITCESHEGSDLDLVVRGPELKPLDDGFFKLLEAIEQSNIPILVQAHDWARLPESFQQEIERDYMVVQEKGTKETTDGEWRELPFSEAVTMNPTVQLDRGTVYPYVEMAAVNADSRMANSLEKREFKGSGSKVSNWRHANGSNYAVPGKRQDRSIPITGRWPKCPWLNGIYRDTWTSWCNR